jgi:hypothetical protein
VSRPCGAGPFGGGVLGTNPDSGAIHFVVSKDAIVLAPERGGARRIYVDGRKHPDLRTWTPTGSGHSVGRIENGELVADTVGIVPGVVTAGGWRTPETHHLSAADTGWKTSDDQVPVGGPPYLPETARVSVRVRSVAGRQLRARVLVRRERPGGTAVGHAAPVATKTRAG